MGASRLAASFWETGSLASAIPQVVELCTPNVGVTNDLDFVNSRRSEQESALHADAVRGNAANREVGVVAAFSQANNRSAEFLNALPLAFANTQVNAHIIAGMQLGDVFVYGCLESLQQFRH